MASPIKDQHELNMTENTNQIQAQIIRGLRYFIVLRILKNQPMHGYGIIRIIRKKFGIYLGPSSIYPLLNDLENRKYLDSTWETENFHPKRIYNLTSQGQNMLNRMERSFGPIIMGNELSKNKN
ncbi:MAG: PadR family transcriptional regulator [Candidatus Bathyarchaeota archaeon]|nr:PadR family transcriptional regulator [Candidatus Bathyarchaeum sp.]